MFCTPHFTIDLYRIICLNTNIRTGKGIELKNAMLYTIEL